MEQISEDAAVTSLKKETAKTSWGHSRPWYEISDIDVLSVGKAELADIGDDTDWIVRKVTAKMSYVDLYVLGESFVNVR